MNFTDKQIEFIKNASDHVEMLCGGRGYGKTHQLINEMQDKINNLQSKIDKAIELIEKEDLITYLRETKDLELANEFEDLYKDLKEDK